MQDINSLLNKAMEIEGLLRVLLVRDDSDVRNLVIIKTQQLAAELSANTAPANEGIQYSSPDFAAGFVPDPRTGQPLGASEAPKEEDIDSLPDLDIDIVEFVPEEPLANEPQAPAQEAPQEPSEPTPPPFPGSAPSMAEAPVQTPTPIPTPKTFLTFNEKYRFVRELFNNQHAKMSEVVAKVTSMHSLSEAHDYVLNELNLDENDPVVIEFLEAIARYFNSLT